MPPNGSSYAELVEGKSGFWRQWLQRPQELWLYKVAFHIHYIVGTMIGVYILLMSLTGSVIVFRDQLSRKVPVAWIVRLHENLLAGQIGRSLNGIGAAVLTLLCLTGAIIWWPGIKNWRRSLTVNWSAHPGRVSWDLHSVLGFWCYLFILVWGISGIYFAFARPFNAFFVYIDPKDRFTDPVLMALTDLHFGRFDLFTQVVWFVAGLVPAVLAATGVFICCRRMIYKQNSNPHHNHIEDHGT